MIIVRFGGFGWVEDVVQRAITLADATGCDVESSHNGRRISAKPGESAALVSMRFERDVEGDTEPTLETHRSVEFVLSGFPKDEKPTSYLAELVSPAPVTTS